MISTMYVKWSQDQYTWGTCKLKTRKIHKSLTTSLKKIWTLPLTKISYANPPPMCMTTIISKLLSLFVTSEKGQVYQVDISSSLGELASSSSSTSSLPKSSSLTSSEASGDGEEATVKPPMTACHRAIQSTRVFTWPNSSLRVLRQASMCTNCAMMASSVTPPTEEEGVEMDGVAGARGAAVSVCVHLRRSWASLRLTVAA